ncbi:MAG TPA: glycosyltransferase [Opitutaceae bacterium]|nr:glycosyltransferase [Opitutaceae bacterium]
MPKLSVIMCSYNHAPFVGAAIASVLNQSFQDFELVITDDGSRDGTADVIRGISDPRIRFHAFPENRGACVAANDTLARVQGEYVAVLNSDDYFLPGKLERQVRFLDGHRDVGAVFGLPQFVAENGQPFHNPTHAFARIFTSENRSRVAWLKHFFYSGNCLCHPTIMLRKACYDRVGRFDPLLMQLPDLDLWVRLCKAYEIHILPEPLTAMRVLDRHSNTSAPSPARLARSAWETSFVLGHYSSLPEQELREIFAGAPGQAEGKSPVISLALEALRVGKPGYIPFGLSLLHDCLRRDPGCFSYGEYFRLVGELDPFTVQFFGREYQLLKKSRVVGAARNLSRWWRSRNFRG